MTLTLKINTFKSLIETRLEREVSFLITDLRKPLKDAIYYSVMAKAKRVRPLICLASFQMFNHHVDQVLPLACALELIHTYSLIHDDLPAMDNDDFRRGQPTCHKKFGEAMAILAGDTLNTYSFELIATQLPAFYSAEKILRVIRELAKSLGIHGMAGGQAMDLNTSIKQGDPSELKSLHRLKTGCLLRACILLPAILEDATAKELEILSQFADHFGMLFQIVDDILDETGTQESLGKSIHKDRKQAKLTSVTAWGISKSQDFAHTEAQEALRCLQALTGRSTEILADWVHYVLNRQS